MPRRRSNHEGPVREEPSVFSRAGRSEAVRAAMEDLGFPKAKAAAAFKQCCCYHSNGGPVEVRGRKIRCHNS